MISVLCATYCDDNSGRNQRHLDMTLRSLEAQSFQDFELVLVSSGPYKPNFRALKNTHENWLHHHSDERLHFPAAIHKAYELSRPDSEYILLINDDIIMNNRLIQNLHEIVSQFELILNPLSNCQNGHLFHTQLGVKLENSFIPFERRKHTMDEIEPVLDHIVQNSIYYEPHLIPVGFCAFFCTMMRRSTWNTVGGIDPVYKTSKDDLDFCLRAHQKKIGSFITFGAFCFHFSGTSADRYATMEEKVFNANYLEQKLGVKVAP